MATVRDDAPFEHSISDMSTPAVRHLLAHLRRRRTVMDEDVRGLEDELRMRSLRDATSPNPFEGLAWDDAVEGQQSLFDYAATLSRTQGR